MKTRPIVVGVDGSPESVRAAVAGALVARRTGLPCHLVHAVPVAAFLAQLPPDTLLDAEHITSAAVEAARREILASLAGQIPIAVLETLDVVPGRAAVVVAAAAQRLGAGLLVMGAKRRRARGLLGGSTITHLLRTGDVPLLATDGTSPNITRVLAAVDLSHAAEVTLAAAEEWAELFGAELRVVHAVEPVSVIAGVPIAVGDEEFLRAARRLLELNVWPRIRRPDSTQTVVRRGVAAAVIAREAERFNADLIVVGSHGRGWVHRLLIGSTTERLLHALPTMALVVPASRPEPRRALADVVMPWEEREPAAVG